MGGRSTVRWTALGLAVAMLTVSVPVMASHGNGNGGGHDTFPGLPDPATFGICTAWDNNENGRDNGQAGGAPPFQWLQDEADDDDQTVEEYCEENGQHPGQGGGNGGGNGNGGGPP